MAATSITANSGVNSMVSTRHVLDDLFLRFDEPRRHDHSSSRGWGQDPVDDTLGVHTCGVEDERRQGQEHAAPKGDQHVVDEPFAGEADEIHAPLVRSQDTAHVRVGNNEPQHHGQMSGHQSAVDPPSTKGYALITTAAMTNGTATIKYWRRASPLRRAK